MVIRLSPKIQKLVERESKARGIKPTQLVEDTLKERFTPKRKPPEQISEARQRLRELAQYKKKGVAFDEALRTARAFAQKQYTDNVEFIEMTAKRHSKPENNPSP